MNKSKKTTLVLSIVGMALLLLVGSTLAYLIFTRTVINTAGIGSKDPNETAVSVIVEEPEFEKQIQQRIANQGNSAGTVKKDPKTGEILYAGMYSLIPTDKITKDPRVKNIGTHPVYVRAKIMYTGSNGSVLGNAMENPYIVGDPTTGKGLGLHFSNEWHQGKDGYYYFIQDGKYTATGSILKVGDSADLLGYHTQGEKISLIVPAGWDYNDISQMIGSGIPGDTYLELDVQVEVVQAKNFSPDLTMNDPWSYTTKDPIVVKPGVKP